MNRFASFSAALVLAAATASSVLAGPSLPTLNSNVVKNLNLAKQLPNNVVINPISACPDLSIETGQIQQSDGSIRITIKVVNRSGADYLSGAGQQILVIQGREGGRSGNLGFGNVRRGTEVIWGDVFRPFEFPATYNARISFDPDLFIDGNPQNDDCRASNNVATITTLR